ncbi:MAG: alpha/beta hydrolase [bacterium]
MAPERRSKRGHTVVDSDFLSQGTRCAGWLFRPGGVADPPVVVMAHGFAAERTFRLPAFAERFAEKGIAAFVFDYRNFGSSDGEPRNLVHPAKHLQDWEAAVAHVRSMRGVHNQRLALWGSSFSGGHVIVTAARDSRIAAIVSQVPFVDGLATIGTLGIKYALQAFVAGMKDVARVLTFRPPYCVPVVGPPDRFAAMNKPDAMKGYLAIVPPGSSWRNECPARVLLATPFYRPISHAANVSCPALLVVADKDALIPAEAVLRTAAKMPKAEVVRMPVGHFDVYVGEIFDEVVQAESEFLARHLLAG